MLVSKFPDGNICHKTGKVRNPNIQASKSYFIMLDSFVYELLNYIMQPIEKLCVQSILSQKACFFCRILNKKPCTPEMAGHLINVFYYKITFKNSTDSKGQKYIKLIQLS